VTGMATPPSGGEGEPANERVLWLEGRSRIAGTLEASSLDDLSKELAGARLDRVTEDLLRWALLQQLPLLQEDDKV
jgi:hypothetical protein